MRLLGLTNHYPPLGYGYGAICRDVMRGLAGRGHDVRVLCAEGGEGEDTFAVRRELGHVPGAWRRPAAGLRAQHRSESAVRRALAEGADAAIAWHMRGIAKGTLTLLHDAGLPVLYALGDLWVVYERPGPPAAWRAWSALDRTVAYRSLRSAAGRAAGAATGLELLPPPIAEQGRCAFTSEWLRRRYAEAGFVPARSHVVPNGLDLAAFPAIEPAGRVRRALFAGRVDATKGADIAIDAVAAVPGLALTMVGQAGPEVGEQVRRLGLADRVTLVGEQPRERLLALLGEHDLFLMPGRVQEGFGLVYLEAMAAGLPVVGTATGGAAEFCEHETNALVVAPDPAAVAAAVRRLQADPALRERMVAAGRSTAARYSLDAMVTRFEALLSP